LPGVSFDASATGASGLATCLWEGDRATISRDDGSDPYIAGDQKVGATMNDQPLGRLERVELRDIWISEATSFTPWLARPENMLVLAETLGIDLELEAQEKAVGPFRADLLCKDIGTDRWVLIENQLEKTDHTHLGQLLTYASGLEAATIVWISSTLDIIDNVSI
jgi:hypothetical protein